VGGPSCGEARYDFVCLSFSSSGNTPKRKWPELALTVFREAKVYQNDIVS
jgi:hypothetical protein